MNQPNPINPEGNDDDRSHDPEQAAREAREAAADDPAFKETDEDAHDPYAHLRPHQWRKGQSGNPNGRPPGIRSLARRFRQAGTLRPGDVEAFGSLAKKLGLKDDTLNGMDIMDLLTISTYLHAISGKSQALAQVIRTLTGTINYTPNDSTNKTPDEWRKDAIRFYEAVLASPDVDIKDKIQARSRLDAIQGLLNDNSTMGAHELADEIRDFLNLSDSSVPDKGDDADDEGATETVLDARAETRVEDV